MKRFATAVVTAGFLALALIAGPTLGQLATGQRTTVLAQNTVKKAANEVGDKAEDVKDATVHGSKKVAEKTVDVSADVKDSTVKGSKKVAKKSEEGASVTAEKTKETGNWFVRTWKKIF